jgi:hypothetical protein
MDNLQRLLAFLAHLERSQIFYRLSSIRDAIMVEVAVPGERWEVEFFGDGHIEIEVFSSVGDVEDLALDDLLERASAWADVRVEPPRDV